MMVSVELRGNKGFPWYQDEKIFVRGYLHDEEGKYYSGPDLLQYFSALDSAATLRKRLMQATGLFSLLWKNDDGLYLAQDIIRAFPLYYLRSGPDWHVSDDAWVLRERMDGPGFNKAAVLEFMGTGYVSGSETLLEGLSQVQAGELLYLSREKQTDFYFSYRCNNSRPDAYSDARNQASGLFQALGNRLVEALDGRTAVVPLSGGYDSRLIAALLKRQGYEKVRCFTYGRAANPELRISEKVAERLGFPWIYVEYTDELMADYREANEFRSYFHQASGLVSMFFLQEYFALKYLKDEGWLPPDAVFLPGHSGDFLGGSQISKHYLPLKEEALRKTVRRIFRIKYLYHPYTPEESRQMKERIRLSLDEKKRGNDDLPYSVHEDWDMKEKLAKFNLNSAGLYSCFGYAFLAPFWDRELVEFFRDLPVEWKLGKKLYDEVLEQEYFQPMGIRFEQELQDEKPSRILVTLRSIMKKLLPAALVNRLVQLDDKICYRESTAPMLQDLKRDGAK